MRILIVEDDSRIHTPLADDLRRQHHAVDVVGDGLVGLDFARTDVHDVILLDILLPRLDGLALCRQLRHENAAKAMIVMITALGDVKDRIAALDSGADDYVVKPFNLSEVSARIRAVCRRQHGTREPILVRGALQLDPSRCTVTHRGVLVPLTSTEYAILETLMRSPMRLFSRAMLRDKVSGFCNGGPRDSVKTHITNLRRKLRSAGVSDDPIESVYGLGYRLADVSR